MKKEKNKKELEKQIPDEDKKSKDESELEEEIEETEGTIKDEEFHEFLRPSAESFSPVLEKVRDAPQQESLEQDVGFVSTSAKEQEDKQIQYNPVNYDENYTRETARDIGSSVEESRKIRESFSVSQPAHMNPETAGRDFRLSPRQVDFVNPELQAIQNQESEIKYVEPERIDVENVGREKAPNRKVQKYEIR